MSFFAELKRRNVFKVAAAYAIVAWLLIQIASILFPTFDAPHWVMRVFTVVILLGFPLALILAWAYELTPEGIKATTSEGPAQYHTRTTGQRLNYFILGLLVLVVTFIVVDNYVLVNKLGTTTVASVAGNASPIATGEANTISKNTASSRSTVASPPPVLRASLMLGDTQPIMEGLGIFIALSRDGRQLVYVAQVNGTRRLYYRPLSQLTARPMPGTVNANDAFFSPDGKWVVYEGNSSLYKVAVAGGAPQRLSAAIGGIPRGAFWGGDNVIYFTANDKLNRISANGGTAEPVILKSKYATWNHGWPSGLPDGTHLLLTVQQNSLNAREGDIILVNLATGKTQLLIRKAYNARYVPTGHIVFMRSDSLWAVPFDVKQHKITGPEIPVVNGIDTASSLGQAVYTISDGGLLIYLPGKDVWSGWAGIKRQLVWVDRNGNETPLPAEILNYSTPCLSPDGTQLAVTVFKKGSGADIWTYDLARNTLSRRTFSGDAFAPLWTPDGTRLAYTFWPGMKGLYWIKADGSGQPKILLDTPRYLPPTAFTPDGSRLIYYEAYTGPFDIYTLSLTGKHTEQPLLASKYSEGLAALSPDGHWLAYQSDETGRYEIYVRPYPNVNAGKWQVSTDGGAEPHWRGDGKELFYRNAGTNDKPVALFAVPVETQQGFQTGKPVELFRGDYFTGITDISYGVTGDGQRFLFIKTVTGSGGSKTMAARKTNLVLVENWFTELKRLAPPSH